MCNVCQMQRDIASPHKSRARFSIFYEAKLYYVCPLRGPFGCAIFVPAPPMCDSAGN